jgi:hypothetical protein
VFDPTSTAQRQLDIRRYQDFDVFLGLVVRSGHIESDGAIVLTRPVVVRLPSTPPRSQADRALHTDDAHIVRGETGATANVMAPEAPATGPAR